MEYIITPPPYHPPNADEALSQIRTIYRKEPDTFRVAILVHGVFEMIAETIAETAEIMERGSGLDENTLAFLAQIKATCQVGAEHLRDLMWPEIPYLSAELGKKLKTGDAATTRELAFAYDDLMHNVSLPLGLFKDYKVDSMKPDLNFLLNRCAESVKRTGTATVLLRFSILDPKKLCPVAANLLKILDPSSTENDDDYSKFRAEMPKWGKFHARKKGLAWECNVCASGVWWPKIKEAPTGSGIPGQPSWLGNGSLVSKKWRVVDVWAIAGHCPRDADHLQHSPLVCLICCSGEARNSMPREMYPGTDELFRHMVQQHWKDAPEIPKESGSCTVM